MLRMTNFLIALSFGTHRAQLVQRTGLTCPRLCLQRPPLRRFLVYKNDKYEKLIICSNDVSCSLGVIIGVKVEDSAIFIFFFNFRSKWKLNTRLVAMS